MDVVAAAGHHPKRAVLHRFRQLALQIEPRTVETHVTVDGFPSWTARQHDDRRAGCPVNRSDLPGTVPQRSELAVERPFALRASARRCARGFRLSGSALGTSQWFEMTNRRPVGAIGIRTPPIPSAGTGARESRRRGRAPPRLDAPRARREDERPDRRRSARPARRRRNVRVAEKPVQLPGNPLRMPGLGTALAPAVARAVVAARPGEPRDLRLNPDPVEGGAAESRFEDDGRGPSPRAVNVEPVVPDVHQDAGRDSQASTAAAPRASPTSTTAATPASTSLDGRRRTDISVRQTGPAAGPETHGARSTASNPSTAPIPGLSVAGASRYRSRVHGDRGGARSSEAGLRTGPGHAPSANRQSK